jgi:putative acyl-CoA dehydrogenase
MPVNSIWEGQAISCAWTCCACWRSSRDSRPAADEFAQVKGQDRHFDRSWRQLQQKLRKPQEAQGREIAQQLAGCRKMLRHASPPVAQAWCRMMLDTRGGTLMSEQVQNDLLLRATGRVG